MDRMRELWGTMSPGEKQYMANKLYKEDRVVAQKVKEYIPGHLLGPVLEKGDLVRVVKAEKDVNNAPEGALGVIVQVDQQDSYLPYSVDYGNNEDGPEWFKEGQLELYKVNTY